MTSTAKQSAQPVPTADVDWIPTGPGKSFKPLRFENDGWSELMRLQPGAIVGLHRHTGDVHAFNLSGYRKIHDTGEIVGPGDYVYEPAGNVDAWEAFGDEPCVIHIKVHGAVEYLDDAGHLTGHADAASQAAAYQTWCRQHDIEPSPRIMRMT